MRHEMPRYIIISAGMVGRSDHHYVFMQVNMNFLETFSCGMRCRATLLFEPA